MRYVLGIDSSGGTGNDDSAIVGICIDTLEQVFEFTDNRMNPVAFARYVAKVGEKFGWAYLVPERNSHGLSVISILREIYPKDKIYKRSIAVNTSRTDGLPRNYGWETQGTTIHYMVDLGKKFLEEGLVIRSERLMEQLQGCAEDENGQIVFGTMHNDIAMAYFLACVGLAKWRRSVDVKRVEERKREWYDGDGRIVYKFDDFLPLVKQTQGWDEEQSW